MQPTSAVNLPAICAEASRSRLAAKGKQVTSCQSQSGAARQSSCASSDTFTTEGGFQMSRLLRPLLGVLIAGTLLIFAATPALAYGAENWQIGFAGTGVAPGTGQSFGFWGWCTFSGGVTSVNDGDCQFAEYIHGPSGSGFTCEESLDISSWDGSTGTFFISGTVTVNPASTT